MTYYPFDIQLTEINSKILNNLTPFIYSRPWNHDMKQTELNTFYSWACNESLAGASKAWKFSTKVNILLKYL